MVAAENKSVDVGRDTFSSSLRLDAMLAALTAIRAAWPDARARLSAQRLRSQAEPEGIGTLTHGVDDPGFLDELTRAITVARRPATDAAVLLVEDDRLSSRIIADVLTAPGRKVLCAYTSADAIRLIREHSISIVLLDLVLPDGDGRDLLAMLRRTPVTSSVPVLVISALQDEMTQAECYALGADALLPKPISPPVILAAVTAHMAQAAEQRNEGRVDGLTRLPNRAGLIDAMERMIPLARRSRQPYAVGMIDLDHFKAVNDKYGHSAGDDVLRQTAQTINRTLRKTDYLARWGGEELCVLLPDTSVRGAVQALGKALDAVRKLEFHAHGASFGITFSAGIADSVEEADRLMYVAKATGRNRIMAPEDEKDPPPQRALLVEDDMAVSNVIVRMLEREGYSVAHFADAVLAMEAVAGEFFAVAIIDLDLPGMNGFELVTRLRALPTAAGLPIVFLTGSSAEEDIVHGFDVGANDYIVKPFHQRELMARISRLLPKR